MRNSFISLVLTGQVSEIARLGAWVSDFCRKSGLGSKSEFELNLALEELATNAITHGQATQVEIGLWEESNFVQAELLDNGSNFDPTTADPPDLSGGIADRQIGGLGIHLVRRLVQDLAWKRIGDRNCLTFRMKAE